MLAKLKLRGLLFLLLVAATCATAARGEIHVKSTPVPPHLEIEILDPGTDPKGNPAVVLREQGPGADLQVDIPPVVLVHRYYYTGNRTFQGPMLPGGPSIIVANHPKTGERCYLEAQMLPGAPRVTYTENKIEYDYGANGVTVCFPIFGQPTIKFRSGTKWTTKAANLVHAEQIHDHCQSLHECVKGTASRTKTATCGALVVVGDAAKTATRPVTNVLRFVPLGNMLVSDQIEERLSERALEHKQERNNRQAMAETQRREQTYSTNR